MRDLGWTPGQNILFEVRSADGKLDRLPGLAVELVRLNVDLIYASAPPQVRAAMQATTTIPIVFSAVADPVGSGFVASLSRPGSNITGVASTVPEGFEGKLLELLKEAVPTAVRVAVLINPANPLRYGRSPSLPAAAQMLGVALQFIEARTEADIEPAFHAAVRARMDALVVIGDPLIFANRSRINDLAVQHSLPAIYPTREYLGTRGLMSYGVSLDDLSRRAASYVDRIFKGARAAELPVEQPSKLELVLNRETAKVLGLTFPRPLLLRADYIIDR
jgi:putative ABC transport system substrate-binding protein